jgi:PTS system arbutin-like IIC component
MLPTTPNAYIKVSIDAAKTACKTNKYGVVGNMGGGLLDFISTNWLPLGKEHWGTYVAQVVINLTSSSVFLRPGNGISNFKIKNLNKKK